MFYTKLSRRSALKAGAVFGAAHALGRVIPSAAHAAAPMLGQWHPKFFRFKLGKFEITQISDAEAFIDGPYPLIGGDASEEEVHTLMRQNHLPETRYQPGFTPTVVNTGKELILFDTGNGEEGFIPRPAGGWLAKQLKPAGFNPEDIDIVVITHGHLDHVGGVMEGGKPLFPNARYVMGAKDHNFWNGMKSHSDKYMAWHLKVFHANADPIAEKFSFINPGDDIVTGIQVVEAYGHTPGHLTFHIESDGQTMFFWADCAHHHVASLARPDWHCVFDFDQEMGAKTRKRIYDMVTTDKLPVIGYHMPFPGIGFVEKLDTAGYRWIPHSFQLNE